MWVKEIPRSPLMTQMLPTYISTALEVALTVLMFTEIYIPTQY